MHIWLTYTNICICICVRVRVRACVPSLMPSISLWRKFLFFSFSPLLLSHYLHILMRFSCSFLSLFHPHAFINVYVRTYTALHLRRNLITCRFFPWSDMHMKMMESHEIEWEQFMKFCTEPVRNKFQSRICFSIYNALIISIHSSAQWLLCWIIRCLFYIHIYIISLLWQCLVACTM